MKKLLIIAILLLLTSPVSAEIVVCSADGKFVGVVIATEEQGSFDVEVYILSNDIRTSIHGAGNYQGDVSEKVLWFKEPGCPSGEQAYIENYLKLSPH